MNVWMLLGCKDWCLKLFIALGRCMSEFIRKFRINYLAKTEILTILMSSDSQ